MVVYRPDLCDFAGKLWIDGDITGAFGRGEQQSEGNGGG